MVSLLLNIAGNLKFAIDNPFDMPKCNENLSIIEKQPIHCFWSHRIHEQLFVLCATCEWSDAIVLRADESNNWKLLLTLDCTFQFELD